jgi:hypothetical protein
VAANTAKFCEFGATSPSTDLQGTVMGQPTHHRFLFNNEPRRRNTMSEHNYFGLAANTNIKNNPDLFSLEGLDAKIAATTKAAAEQFEKNKLARETAKGTNTPRAEYNKLRGKLYDLQQTAKDTEIRLNDAVASVHHFEVIVADLLKKKKDATVANLLGEERMYEHRLIRSEKELMDARESLLRWQKTNTSSARQLREFDGHARITELKKELGF